jgi:enoyl-CoA hydratase
MPSWELSVRLPAAVGRRTATWMSLTGNPLSAIRAELAGLVCEVCAHEELLDRALALAEDIASADADAARALLGSYRTGEDAVWSAGFEIEDATSREWLARPDRRSVDERREQLFARNRDKFASGTRTPPD